MKRKARRASGKVNAALRSPGYSFDTAAACPGFFAPFLSGSRSNKRERPGPTAPRSSSTNSLYLGCDDGDALNEGGQ